jgi:hypothetical protein
VQATSSSPTTGSQHTIEINSQGNWISVPALHVAGKNIIVQGKRMSVAKVHDEDWLETELESPQECIELLKKQRARGLRADIFTFAQKPSRVNPMYEYPMERDSVAAIRLTSFKEWWEKLPQEARKNVRRSQKRGVTVELRAFDEQLVKGIADVNNDSPIRQRERNLYYGRSLEQIRKDYSSFLERSDFICAFAGEEMIGFLKLVYRGEVASILNFTPKASHADKRPANALIAKAVELCDAKGIQYVTYGKYSYGNKRNSPLTEFKDRNGFEEILVPRFYVPLTNWGRICLGLKLHRGLLGLLPEGVINMGIRAREKWYRYQYQSVEKPV